MARSHWSLWASAPKKWATKGNRARSQMLLNPNQSIYGAKRLVGRDFDNPRVDPVAAAHLVRHVLYSMTSDEWHSGACEWGLQTTDG